MSSIIWRLDVIFELPLTFTWSALNIVVRDRPFFWLILLFPKSLRLKMEICQSWNDIRHRIPLPVFKISCKTMKQTSFHVRHTTLSSAEGPQLCSSEERWIKMQVLGHSLVSSLVRLHYSFIRCAHSLTPELLGNEWLAVLKSGCSEPQCAGADTVAKDRWERRRHLAGNCAPSIHEPSRMALWARIEKNTEWIVI